MADWDDIFNSMAMLNWNDIFRGKARNELWDCFQGELFSIIYKFVPSFKRRNKAETSCS